VGRGQKTAPGEAQLDAWILWRGNQACGEEIGAVFDEERKTSREELRTATTSVIAVSQLSVSLAFTPMASLQAFRLAITNNGAIGLAGYVARCDYHLREALKEALRKADISESELPVLEEALKEDAKSDAIGKSLCSTPWTISSLGLVR
jgi:hypothetical protein